MSILKRSNIFSIFLLLLILGCNNNDDPTDIPSKLSVALPTPPVKVKNTNGTWLVYDLHVTARNLEKVQIFKGADLQLSYDSFLSQDDMNIGSIWLPYPQDGWAGEELTHRFHWTDSTGNQAHADFTLELSNQYADPVTIAFPVPQGVWLAEGAPGSTSYHTRALFPYDTPVYDHEQQAYLFGNNPQRYAIDYAKLVDGLPYANDGSSLEDWYCYNLPVTAALDGTVIYTKDGIPDNQTPFELDYPTDINNATGNVIYIEHADGTIANYSHLVPNSILVSKGDTVTVGQELARLGNSGNSFAPHLHMHVLTNPENKELQEYPDGLFMESLPYKFSQFTKLGTLPVGYLDLNPIYPFAPTTTEILHNTLPAESDVIEF